MYYTIFKFSDSEYNSLILKIKSTTYRIYTIE